MLVWFVGSHVQSGKEGVSGETEVEVPGMSDSVQATGQGSSAVNNAEIMAMLLFRFEQLTRS